ncbi:gas vesicle protein [Pseudonocardia alni]|uniref:Gas vesicle protein GvpA/GvpJ/GvpM family n=1 Tax=Pseudonocardia alni TaxID=33907 RepID=A0AA44UTJ7_PSEA5|nr:gas vesicle protein GvpA/GvpJ/GvpM family [Pseudonocardia alni]
MSDAVRWSSPGAPQRRTERPPQQSGTDLADILERVLDKGIVIAGDIQVNLLDIELLTIKIRLVVASVDRAKEMGIDWWERDPTLSGGRDELEEENARLRDRVERLERLLPADERSAPSDDTHDGPDGASARADDAAVERSIDRAVADAETDAETDGTAADDAADGPADETDDDGPGEDEPGEAEPDDGPDPAGHGDRAGAEQDGDGPEAPPRRTRPAATRRRRTTTTRRPARGKD